MGFKGDGAFVALCPGRVGRVGHSGNGRKHLSCPQNLNVRQR